MNYDKLLLDELRFVTYEKSDAGLTEEQLIKAVTLNENLQSLGYVLNPEDLTAIAVSPSLDGFFEKVRSITDRVHAKPMYPGFPQQVMEMDEAVFRFHQMVHYFSTYGMELLFGSEVKRGWLPADNTDTGTSREQKIILKAKHIKLLPMEHAYLLPLRMILERKERMTLPEKELAAEAILHISPAQITDLIIGFKENMNALYGIVFDMPDREAAFEFLRGLCQHTGDVLRCVDVLLGKNKFHFRTSQKRFLVKLLESYPAGDFRANLILSNKGAQRNILLLNYLDYTVYSRSEEHRDAVNDLRDGKLRSWESIAKSLLSSGDEGALDFLVKRPGMMLRMVAWLLRLGYTPRVIVDKLSEHASALSTQTLVSNMNYFGKLTEEDRADTNTLYEVFEELLSARMKQIKTPLYGKKVLLRMDEFDLDRSEIRCSEKSAEGGYIRSGIAYRIPPEIKALRFFVYWNDKDRVDVDLHSAFIDREGTCHNVGWNHAFRDCGVVFSGDITHSDAAEYIDIDLTAPIDKVQTEIHLYSGKAGFNKIDTCYVGMMAVPDDSTDGRETALYKEANCFFRHYLRLNCTFMNYGYIDVPSRCLVFNGEPQDPYMSQPGKLGSRHSRLTLNRYLRLLMDAQEATICDTEEEANIVLIMGKATTEKELSLMDRNYFME